ncbi:uncharacterized protein TRIVIDRAFT_211126, partial [Trichoderma virens Gv29-8]
MHSFQRPRFPPAFTGSPQTTVLPEWKLHLCLFRCFALFAFTPHYFLIIQKEVYSTYALAESVSARAQLYIPHTLYHINAHTQSMFLFETKWATRRQLDGMARWMGWVDDMLGVRGIAGNHPLASPNNDGLGSAFVYTTSRMNAIQKAIN